MSDRAWRGDPGAWRENWTPLYETNPKRSSISPELREINRLSREIQERREILVEADQARKQREMDEHVADEVAESQRQLREKRPPVTEEERLHQEELAEQHRGLVDNGLSEVFFKPIYEEDLRYGEQ